MAKAIESRICIICGCSYQPIGWSSMVCSNKECKRKRARQNYERRRDAGLVDLTRAVNSTTDFCNGMNTDFSYGDKQREEYEQNDRIVFPDWVKVTRRCVN